jgi:hypothetical protein
MCVGDGELYNMYAFERAKDSYQVLGEQKGKRKHIGES